MTRVLAVVLLIASCAPATPPPSEQAAAPAMRHVFDTWASKIDQARTEVIRSESLWREAWPEITPSGEPPPAPAVDFSREMVLLAARGTQSNGCALIKIESVARDAAGLVVTVAHINPGSRCGCIAALAHPVDIVAIPRTDEKVRFAFVTRVNECP
jgi:hypothetical protein